MTDGPGYAGLLRGLDPSALEDLLSRREEAGEPLRGPSPRFEDLASVLARHHSVKRAVDRLDGFLLPLLHVLVWFGPVVPRTVLLEQIPGVGDEARERGLDGLARWGLAFPRGRGGDRAVIVPHCVQTVVEAPGGLGAPARDLRALRTLDALVGEAANLGMPQAIRPRKDDLVAAIVARISEPGMVAEMLADGPEEASELLLGIRQSGGAVTTADLEREAGIPGWRMGPFDGQPSPGLLGPTGAVDTLAWLLGRALVALAPGAFRAPSRICIPGEVELSLRGGLVFPRWEPEPPLPQVVRMSAQAEAGGSVPRATSPPSADPSLVLAQLTGVLDEWAARPPTSLKRGGAGVRDLRRTAKALGLEERLVHFLYALAVEMGLVHEEGGAIRPSPEVERWAGESPARQWAELFEAWRGVRLWTEGDSGGLVPLADATAHASLREVRTAVMATLASFPPAHGVPVTTLGEPVFWRLPSVFHCAECARIASRRVVEALLRLGTAVSSNPLPEEAQEASTESEDRKDAAPVAVALAEPARTALSDPGWASRPGGPASLFHKPVATCTVQADLHVIVPGSPVRELAEGLGAFADLERSNPARVYRLSERSIRRALDSGMRSGDFIRLLERFAPRGIPQNVVYLIEDVARRHGSLVVGAAGLLVRSDDPALLAAVASERRLAKLGPRLLAPTVLAVEETRMDRLLAALRDAGYMPVGDPRRAADAERAAGRRGLPGRRLLPPREPPDGARSPLAPPAMGPGDAASLAARLLGSARRGTGSRVRKPGGNGAGRRGAGGSGAGGNGARGKRPARKGARRRGR